MVADFAGGGGDGVISFELEDFRVVEASAAVRLLSVLSLAGFYQLIEGDGVHFDTGRARIELAGNQQIIHEAEASGTALAVDMVGIVDSESETLEVSGILVPINTITRLLGRVPVLGDLLTGIDKSGILVTQFTVRGAIDDPETSVNLSSIVPGVLRDIFSSDWVSKEYERLIGSDNSLDISSDNSTQE